MIKVNPNFILWGIAIIVIFLMISRRFTVDRYMYSRPITTDRSDVPNIFKGKRSIECIPGPGPDADYYTSEDSQGLCGLQDYVHTLSQKYSINNGIGGSLLD